MDILVTFEDGTKELRAARSPVVEDVQAGEETSPHRWPTWQPANGLVLVPSAGGWRVSNAIPTQPIEALRGRRAIVWRITGGWGEKEPLAGEWQSCRVETVGEQIARLTAERDAEKARADRMTRCFAAVGRLTVKVGRKWHSERERADAAEERLAGETMRANLAEEVVRRLMRVRGGAPEHVASLREQCEAAGVEFVEETEGRLFQPSKEFPWGWECPNEVPSDEPPKEVVTHTTRNGKGRVARVLRRKAAGGGGVMDLSPQDTYQVWWGYQTSEAPEGDGEWREVEAEDPAQAARWFGDDLIRNGEVSHDDVLKVFVRGHGSWLFRFEAKVRVASVEKA